MSRFWSSCGAINSHCLPCPVDFSNDISSNHDGLVIVSENPSHLTGPLQSIKPFIEDFNKINKSFLEKGGLLPANVPGGRIFYAPTGPLNRDYDDVRRFSDAASFGINRAIEAGMKKPLFICPPNPTFKSCQTVSLLGAMQELYVPLEIREHKPDKKTKLDCLLIWKDMEDNAAEACILESGRLLCRDIGGSDPERMCPVKVEEHIAAIFDKSGIQMNVINDQEVLAKDYPLLHIVNRGSLDQERYHGRVIYLTYEGEGPITSTLYLVGKGVTYDTGGHDIKTGGIMAGMHRDKCGAAAVAGIMLSLSLWKPKGIRVVGGLGIVRNCVGVNAYVSDELVTSRAGVRVRVDNTDAEGRMVMADILCKFKEDALKAVNPHLFTIATLTGHARMTVGEGYSIILDNGPAKRQRFSSLFQSIGEEFGDMFEISTIRREDYKAHKGKSEYEDIVQSTRDPKVKNSRGHQKPTAFLVLASGLDKHGMDSSTPLKYSHIDIAGSSGPYPGIPSGCTVSTFIEYIKSLQENIN